MREGCRVSVEALEGRVLFSTAIFSPALCLPPSSTPTPTGPVASSPTPAPPPPAPTPTVRHRHRHHRAPSATPIPVVPVPVALGQWQGDLVDSNGPAGTSLAVNVTQSKSGELFAKFEFTGSLSLRGSTQVTYDSTTQHFRVWIISPKLVMKIEGKPFTNSDGVTQLQSEIQYYTRRGAFKGQVTLQHSDSRA